MLHFQGGVLRNAVVAGVLAAGLGGGTAWAIPVITNLSGSPIHAGDAVTFSVADDPAELHSSLLDVWIADYGLVFDHAAFDLDPDQISVSAPFEKFFSATQTSVGLLFDPLASAATPPVGGSAVELFQFTLVAKPGSGSPSGLSYDIAVAMPDQGNYGQTLAYTLGDPLPYGPTTAQVTVIGTPLAVPEPASAMLVVTAMAGLAATRRRRNTA
jgi:hypothetical protein